MKIFYSLEVFFPHISGVTIVTDRLASYFGSRSNEVFVVTASDKGDFLIEKSPTGGYSIIKMRSYPSPLGKKTKVSYFAQLRAKEIFEQYRPDLIHLQDPLFISLALAQEAKERKIPIIITQHNSLFFPLAYLGLSKIIQKSPKIINFYYKNFFEKYCDLIITPSHFIEEEIKNLGIHKPIEVISNGVDIKLIESIKVNEEFLEKYQLKDLLNYPIILYVGRMSKEKNLEVFLKIVPEILKQKEVYFIFIGEGRMKEKLMKEFSKMKVLEKVRFFSSVEREDLYRFYKIATCLVMPSYLEAQSLVTLEAKAAGLVVIGANRGGVKELIISEEDGLLVDPFSPSEFIYAILKILEDKLFYKKIQGNSKKSIKSHDIQIIFNTLEEIYRSLILKT